MVTADPLQRTSFLDGTGLCFYIWRICTFRNDLRLRLITQNNREKSLDHILQRINTRWRVGILCCTSYTSFLVVKICPRLKYVWLVQVSWDHIFSWILIAAEIKERKKKTVNYFTKHARDTFIYDKKLYKSAPKVTNQVTYIKEKTTRVSKSSRSTLSCKSAPWHYQNETTVIGR